MKFLFACILWFSFLCAIGNYIGPLVFTHIAEPFAYHTSCIIDKCPKYRMVWYVKEDKPIKLQINDNKEIINVSY